MWGGNSTRQPNILQPQKKTACCRALFISRYYYTGLITNQLYKEYRALCCSKMQRLVSFE